MPVFHDQLMKEEEELNRWHHVFGRLAVAVDISLGKYLEVVSEVESHVSACTKDIHISSLMLMYDFAEAIDGVSILVRAGSGKNCSQMLRTAFEIELGLLFIFEGEDNYERRSLAYEYYHLRDGLKLAQKCDPQHETGKQLRNELKSDEHADVFEVPVSLDIKKVIEDKEKRVNSSRYEVVRSEINRIKVEQKKANSEWKPFAGSDANWFSLWGGPTNVRGLAVRLGVLSSYEVLYRNWSNTIHGQGALKRISGPAGDGRVFLDPIRSPKGLRESCKYACNLTNRLTKALVDKLVPHSREKLEGWFIAQMKPAMDFIQSVRMRG